MPIEWTLLLKTWTPKAQIDWFNAYDVNLDADSIEFTQNSSIYLLSTPTLNLLRPCPNLEMHHCTVWKKWNTIKNRAILAVYYASDSSVSFKPTSVDFTLMLA